METPTSGGSSESETSEETVTPIRSPSTSTLRIETPCGQSRINPRRSSPVVMAENATEPACEGGGGEIRTHGARGLRGFQDLPVRPLRHPAAPSSVAAVATMEDLDELALAMPEASKDIEDGRPVYKVHGEDVLLPPQPPAGRCGSEDGRAARRRPRLPRRRPRREGAPALRRARHLLHHAALERLLGGAHAHPRPRPARPRRAARSGRGGVADARAEAAREDVAPRGPGGADPA